MSLYSENRVDEDYGVDMEALVEAYLIDDLTHNYGEKTIKEFCAPGGIADALLEARVLKNKRTIVRLSKQDDLGRRKSIAAVAMAREHNDPLYAKAVKYKALYKQSLAKINEKYGNRANKAAIAGQKAYIKTMKHVNLSNSLNGSFLTKDPNR